MEQLLQITSVPLRYQLSIERARLEMNPERTAPEYKRTPAKVEMHQEISKMRQDSFEFRKGLGLKTVRTANDEAAKRGVSDAIRATGQYTDFGNQLVHIEKGANIPDTAWSQYFQRATEGSLVFVPLSPVDISWSQGGADISYTPATMDFSWSRPKTNFEFVPGNVTMNIEQYPRLEIKFLGGPIYVPPSADPNYEASA